MASNLRIRNQCVLLEHQANAHADLKRELVQAENVDYFKQYNQQVGAQRSMGSGSGNLMALFVLLLELQPAMLKLWVNV